MLVPQSFFIKAILTGIQCNDKNKNRKNEMVTQMITGSCKLYVQ